MQHAFIRALALGLIGLLSACGSLPSLPVLGSDDAREETMAEAPQESAALPDTDPAVAAALPGIVVPTPELNAGTRHRIVERLQQLTLVRVKQKHGAVIIGGPHEQIVSERRH